jgi:uncharacterized protein (TIRG00374 family)
MQNNPVIKNKKTVKILKILRWIFTIGILFYVIYYLVSHREQLASLKEIRPGLLGCLFVFNLANTIIYAIRLKIIIQKKGDVVLPFWSWLKFFLISRFLGLYAGQMGNVYRAAVLKKKYNVSLTRYISSFFFITWLDVCLGLVFAFFIIICFSRSMVLFGMNAAGLVAVLALMIFTAPIIIYSILTRIQAQGTFFVWLQVRLSDMLGAVVDSFRDPAYIFKICLSGFVSFLNSSTLIYLCFRALGLDVSFADATLFFVIVKLCNRIIITPGNLGVREYAYGILSDQLALGMPQGILVSAIIRIITLLTTTFLGVLVGGYDTIQKVRKNESEENISSSD